MRRRKFGMGSWWLVVSHAAESSCASATRAIAGIATAARTDALRLRKTRRDAGTSARGRSMATAPNLRDTRSADRIVRSPPTLATRLRPSSAGKTSRQFKLLSSHFGIQQDNFVEVILSLGSGEIAA